MRSGAKVLVLATSLAAAVGAVLWLVRDAAPPQDDGAPLPPPTAAPRPQRASPTPRHGEKTKPAKDEDDVGPLVIEPASPIVARVVDAAGPVAGAHLALGTFFGTVFESATTDAKGVAKFASSPVADAWLFAYAKGRGRARGEVPEQ